MEDQSENATTTIEEKAPEANEAVTPEMDKKRSEAQGLSALGNQMQSQKKYHEAYEYYRKSRLAYEKIGDKEGTATQLKHMGTIKEILAEYAESLKYYKESKELFRELDNKEEFYEVIDRLAKTFFKDKKTEDAIKEYREAIDFGCKNGDLYNNIGFVYLHSNQVEQALTFLEQAKELREAENSDFIDLTINNLGTAAFLSGEYEKAKDLFIKALEANRRKPKDDRTISFVVFANEKYRSDDIPAFECYNDVLTTSAEHLNIAAAHTQLKNKEEAYRHCEMAHSLDPDMPYLFLPSAWIYLTFGENDRAIGYFKKVLSHAPGSNPIIEIVKQLNPYVFMKIGRNEPCPCDSGKKFKKCHGKGL